MAQITKKFIAANAVDESKIKLSNNSALKARNAADSADVDIIKLNASDLPDVGGKKLQGVADPAAAQDASTKNYDDNHLASRIVSTAAPTNGDVMAWNSGSSQWEPTVSSSSTEFSDDTFAIKDDGDPTKKITFQAAGIATATSRTITMPDADVDLGNLTDSNIAPAAAIAYSKLALNGSIVLTDMAPNSVDESKIKASSINAAGALDGGSGTKLAARVDGVTIKINAANNLESLKPKKEAITLSGTDITNQYVDLAFEASADSVRVSVNGVEQYETADYILSVVGGVTRVTFAGDLATGGAAELVAADVLNVQYSYLAA